MVNSSMEPQKARIPLRLQARNPFRIKRWEPLIIGVLVVLFGTFIWVLQENIQRFFFNYSVEAERLVSSENRYNMRAASVALNVRHGDLRLIISDYLRTTELPADYYDITLIRFNEQTIQVGALSQKLITRNLTQDYGRLDRSSQPYIVGKWGSYKVLGDDMLDS